MGFVVDKVALGQVFFSEFFGFVLSILLFHANFILLSSGGLSLGALEAAVLIWSHPTVTDNNMGGRFLFVINGSGIVVGYLYHRQSMIMYEVWTCINVACCNM
jgi:hypothetical protein